MVGRRVLSVLMVAILAGLAAPRVEALSALEDLDADFWGGINKICKTVAHDLEVVAGPPDTLFLRLVEYTTLGMRSYPVFPSAARAVMRSSHFDPKKRTVIFVHGFTDNPALLSGQSFALAYKLHGGFNILALDSSKLIKALYLRSSVLVKYIGEMLGLIVHDFVANGVDPESIQIVGHSLGAHIGGFAGKAFKMLNSNKRLPRITGMDPAGPCFTGLDSDQRLDKEDANFVDVIHTNIGVYGINETIGTVDFHPNGGGLRQPLCVESACSHNRVWQLWEAALNHPNLFLAVRCDSEEQFKSGQCSKHERVLMGYSTPVTTRGVFYLKTSGIIPFGLGVLGV